MRALRFRSPPAHAARTSLRTLSPCGCALMLSLVTALAQAQPPDLLVEREAGAESCPDDVMLTLLVSSVRGQERGGNIPYRVRFQRAPGAFSVLIESQRDPSTRTLSDAGEDCTALARATAVTLALLIDAEPTVATPVAPPAVPASAAVAPASPPSLEPKHRSLSYAFQLGPALLVGVAQPISPAAFASVELASTRLRAELGALWSPTQEQRFGPGRVSTSLLAGTLALCVSPLRVPIARLEICSGIFIGRLHGEARGYTRDDAVSRVWAALPIGLALTGDSRPLGWQVGGSALLPLQPHDFRVEGLGVPYQSSSVAGLFYVRAALRH